MVLVHATDMRQQALAILAAEGVPPSQARTQVDLLVDAELRGLPSHGILRLERLVNRIRNGVADPVATGKHHWLGSAYLRVDGEGGLGPVVALAAIEALKPRVGDAGLAIAAIANSNHIGALSWYAEQIAASGLVAIVLTTSEALVHPWGGYSAMLGTNPIAIGVPTAGKPFVMDMATGIVSMGKIHDHANRREPIPAGWALDADGLPTTDAERAKGGAISPMAGGKGYALGLAFELLVSALTGAALGTAVKGTLDAVNPANKGDVFILIDPAAGQGAAISAYLDALRALPPAAGFDRVLVPGDRSDATKADRLQNGIPVADEVWTRLLALTGGKPQ